MLLGNNDTKGSSLQSHAGALLEIMENRKMRQDYVHVLVDAMGGEVVQGMFQWSPGRICNQFAHTLAERNTAFNTGFDLLERMSGFNRIVCVPETDEKKREEVEDSIFNSKTKIQEAEIAFIKKVLEAEAMNPTEEAVVYDIQKRKLTATEDEKNLLDVLVHYIKFDKDFRPMLQWSDIYAMQDTSKSHILDNAKVFGMVGSGNWLHNDKQTLYYNSFPETVRQRKPMFETIIAACRLAGFDYLSGTTTKSKIDANKAEILRLVRAATLKTGEADTKCKADPVKALKAALKLVGYSIKVSRKRTEGVRERSYEITRGCTMKKITQLSNGAKIVVDTDKLLPHYKNIEDNWDFQDDPKLAMVSAANASVYSSKAKAAMAAAFAAVAAIAVYRIASSFEVSEPSQKKQRI